MNKLNSAIKYKTGTVLRLNKKIFKFEEMTYALFLRTRQRTKIRNAFVNNILTCIRLRKAQRSKIIQSDGFFWFLVS